MNAATLKELALQASYPRGIAARVDSADLARLLKERVDLLAALNTITGEWSYDSDADTCECGEFVDYAIAVHEARKRETPTCRHTRAHAALEKAAK